MRAATEPGNLRFRHTTRNRPAESLRNRRNLERQSGTRRPRSTPRPLRKFAINSKRSRMHRTTQRVVNPLYMSVSEKTTSSERRNLCGDACRRHPSRQGRLHGGAEGHEHRHRQRLQATSLTRCCSRTAGRNHFTVVEAWSEQGGARRACHGRAYANFSRESFRRLPARSTTSAFIQSAGVERAAHFCGGKT